MNHVLMLGSSLRAGVLAHLRAAELTPHLVLTPSGGRFRSLAESIAQAGFVTRSVTRADVGAQLRLEQPSVVLCVGWPFLFGPDVVGGPWLLLNSHPTLLPKHRGPNPWYYVIAEGHQSCGVTVHKIDGGMDSGPILHQTRVELSPFDTYLSLRSKLVALEPLVIAEALRRAEAESPDFVVQNETDATTYLERRTPEHSVVDSSRPLTELIDSIRACDPDSFPAFFYHHGQKVYIRLWRQQRPAGESDETL